tara:strand:- start:1843 stop:2058 length:216 start_codon:yes stop_codon:yes gene_type:complete
MQIEKKIKSYGDIELLNKTESHEIIRALLEYIKPDTIIQPKAEDLMKKHCDLINRHLYWINQVNLNQRNEV